MSSSHFKDLFRRFLPVALLAIVIGALSWVAPAARPIHAATIFVVNSTSDLHDANTADNLCDAGGGVCTLRAAIEQANATAGADTINFNIDFNNNLLNCDATTGVCTIALDLTAGFQTLSITDALLIDGYTQGTATAHPASVNNLLPTGGTNAAIKIVVEGCGCFDGFDVTSLGATTIKGLSIQDFATGIHLAGGGSHIIQGNFIGMAPDGTTIGGSQLGVVVDSTNNLIGGATAAARNLISGNAFGVDLENDSNTIKGNLVGPDATGIAGPGNFFVGIGLGINASSFGASSNTIGGMTPVERNVISGNATTAIPGLAALFISLGSLNVVQGNYIGTTAAGDLWLPNGVGLLIAGGNNNTIGGTAPGAGNLVSGNFTDGIELISCGCLSVTSNKVQGNFIGTNAAGTAALPSNPPNQFQTNGIVISGADPLDVANNNLIGGTTPGAGNLISGNSGVGVNIAGPGFGGNGLETAFNMVQGNLIGTDVTGTLAVPNGGSGVAITNASSNTVGGSTPAARNVISGSGSGGGVDVEFQFSLNNEIKGNYIGTNAAGTAALGNNGGGISVDSAAINTKIGGAAPGEGNLISGNDVGILLSNSTGTQIYGNLIGTNAAGTTGLGNTNQGLSINGGAKNNVIGGIGAGQGNVIAFNTGGGTGAVYVDGGATPNSTFANSIRGNRIFTNASPGIHLVNQGNNELPKPVISTVGLNTASGTVSTPNATIDLYSGDTASNALKYEGTTVATGTTWTYTGANFQNPFVLATATDAQNDTSEFATGSTQPSPVFTSPNVATFTVAQANTFAITTNFAGGPLASQVTISLLSGTLPAGVTLTDNHNGTATLAGNPPVVGASPYSLTFRASYLTNNTDQTFTLTILLNGVPPHITSPNSAAFLIGQPNTFVVTSTGSPTANVTIGGVALPSGITFTPNASGGGTLAGTPAAGTLGSYALSFTANNGVNPNDVQPFTLNIAPSAVPPLITSPALTSFTVGVAGSFQVTTTGVPTPAITRGGVPLPSGLSFADNGNGTGTLSGTPAAATQGSYAISFVANNGASPNATQPFALTVNPAVAQAAPNITSLALTTFTIGTSGNFMVTTTGSPTPTLTRGGVALPSGVSFSDNGNGTGTLSGTPAAGTGGTYAIVFFATNGVTSNATQNFTLTVSTAVAQVAPQITSVNATTFTTGTPGSFTVTTTGSPTPAITRSGVPLPSGVAFTDNLNGTGTLAGTAATGTQGTYAISFVASNAVNPPAMQSFTLTIKAPAAVPPLISKTFTLTPASNPNPAGGKGISLPTYAVGGTAILSFTLTNPNAAQALSGVGFSDPLPAGLLVATPNALTNTCGGLVTAVSLSGTITLAGATLAPSATCTITLNTLATVAGLKSNVTTPVTSTESGPGLTATASVTVVGQAQAAVITMTANPMQIDLNGMSSLVITITNPNPAVPLTGVAFNVGALPAGVVVATPNGASTTCGGVLTAVAGASSFGLTGGSLLPAASCTVTVAVKGTTEGAKTIATGPVTSVEGAPGSQWSLVLQVGALHKGI